MVQLVLQGNEGVVAVLGELDVAKDGTGDVRADLGGVRQDLDDLLLLVLGLDYPEVGRGDAAAEDVEVEGDALEAEHVISVGGDFDLELRGFLDSIDDGPLIVFGVLVKLDPIVEAEVLELGLGEPAAAQVSMVHCRRATQAAGDRKAARSPRGGAESGTHFWPRASYSLYLSTEMVGMVRLCAQCLSYVIIVAPNVEDSVATGGAGLGGMWS